MITIDRQSSYLAWRINQNPHYDYKYLLYYQNSRLCGYMIFLINAIRLHDHRHPCLGKGDGRFQYDDFVSDLVCREIGGGCRHMPHTGRQRGIESRLCEE
jgi:hypothetical protein